MACGEMDGSVLEDDDEVAGDIGDAAARVFLFLILFLILDLVLLGATCSGTSSDILAAASLLEILAEG